MKKKIILAAIALVAVAGGVAGLSAFEAHVINVTAKIENALRVPTEPIDFGTVFPQEELDRTFDVALSQSFLDENRVDDVEYAIRQKPKCGVTTDNGQTLVGPTGTGHVSLDSEDQVVIDCGPAPRDLTTGETWDVLPLLCPYLSKHEITEDGSETNNDSDVPAFHEPWTFSNHQVVWTEALGRLSKLAGDTLDTWNLDLKVPCFGGNCAQDWEAFVTGINASATPAQYVQPIAEEHKVFGCDLWIEVNGVSVAVPCVPGDFTVVSDTTNTVEGNGNAVAVSSPHPSWTASIPGATWIWSEDPVSTENNQTETFVKQFNVSGTSVSAASLMIATDNTYSVEVNGSAVCSSADENNFQLGTQDVCPVTNLVAGANTLEITVNNIGVGSSANPAGLLYKLSYTTACGTLGCAEKADAMLVLDRSGSVGDNLTDLKNAAHAFVTALSPATDGAHLGQVSFSSSATLDVHLTADGSVVDTAIDALVSAGFTNLEDALLQATAEFANPGDGHDRADADSADFIVLITDGAPTASNGPDTHEQDAINAANAADAAGITIYVVGVGTDTSTADFLENSIATSPAHYFDAADFDDLQAILESLTTCNGD
ncbi:MAG: VWA domain-containing protein [Candidatus Wildermuthbacteria bacterium]|nr:VWA domain-containing protein [Candidatus Wildermuthbacteria bacterium]